MGLFFLLKVKYRTDILQIKSQVHLRIFFLLLGFIAGVSRSFLARFRASFLHLWFWMSAPLTESHPVQRRAAPCSAVHCSALQCSSVHGKRESPCGLWGRLHDSGMTTEEIIKTRRTSLFHCEEQMTSLQTFCDSFPPPSAFPVHVFL